MTTANGPSERVCSDGPFRHLWREDSEVPVVVFGVLGLADDVGRSRTGEEVVVRSPAEVNRVVVEFSRRLGGVCLG